VTHDGVSSGSFHLHMAHGACMEDGAAKFIPLASLFLALPDMSRSPITGLRANPAINPAAVVADEKAGIVDRFNEVEIDMPMLAP
jgi:hypothetical protein